MDTHDKDFPSAATTHDGPVTHARHATYVDPDCDASLDEIIAECFDTDSSTAGWEFGTQRARHYRDAFVADLLTVHGSACATAGGRADVKAIARVRMVSLAHRCVARDWHTADHLGQKGVGSGEDGVADRRSFKRGMFAGFLYGMADAVSREVDGRSLVEA